jgi:hypothetical protein
MTEKVEKISGKVQVQCLKTMAIILSHPELAADQSPASS